MANKNTISGSITALVTPFKNGKVDDQRYQKFVNWQIEQGTTGLVPCGTTGEASTLSVNEHIRVVDLCVEAAAGRVPVIAGIGSNNTLTAIKLAKKAKKSGADAGLGVTPYYNKPGQEGMYQHYKKVCETVDLPVIIYNIPGRSIVDINVETMGRISKLPNVIGLKDATSDISRVSEYTEACGDDFIQLSGDDPTALGHWAHGGQGCISVASNVAPAKCADFHKACANGDFKTAREIHEQLDRLFKDLFLDASPAPTKYALSLLGMMEPTVRLPLLECREETKAAVKTAMRRAGLDF